MSSTTKRVKTDENGGFKQPDSNFCTRFVEDVTGTCGCRPTFRAVDGDRTIDVPASFSPRHRFYLALCFKLATLGTIIYTVYWGLAQDARVFWLAYLTHWALIFALLYSVMSVVNCIFPVAQPPPGETIVGLRVKVTWVLFEVAAHKQALVTLLYWLVLFDGDMETISIFTHGIVAALILFDGLIVNTTPVRLRHWLEFVVVVDFLYLLWSFLHSPIVFGIGNPDYYDEDEETNDDGIYGVLDWGNNPKKTGILGALILFGASPLIHFLLWTLSGFRRRYVPEDTSSGAKYVEMGGLA